MTKAGEYTVSAEEVSILAQTSENFPMMNWGKAMLKDGEKRFSQRYLDFIVNSELKHFFTKRA